MPFLLLDLGFFFFFNLFKQAYLNMSETILTKDNSNNKYIPDSILTYHLNEQNNPLLWKQVFWCYLPNQVYIKIILASERADYEDTFYTSNRRKFIQSVLGLLSRDPSFNPGVSDNLLI